MLESNIAGLTSGSVEGKPFSSEGSTKGTVGEVGDHTFLT